MPKLHALDEQFEEGVDADVHGRRGKVVHRLLMLAVVALGADMIAALPVHRRREMVARFLHSRLRGRDSVGGLLLRLHELPDLVLERIHLVTEAIDLFLRCLAGHGSRQGCH
jgi:hypothetical protein